MTPSVILGWIALALLVYGIYPLKNRMIRCTLIILGLVIMAISITTFIQKEKENTKYELPAMGFDSSSGGEGI